MINSLRNLLREAGPWGQLTPPPAPAQTHEVTTDDGLRLTLRRVPPAGQSRGGPPVMLLHGLAANHRAFHLRDRSLAAWLAMRGHDVWLPELRGHGDSDRPEQGWRLDDYLHRDLPLLLEAILAETGARHLHWVGHSMGGILLMGYGILNPDAPIASGLAIGSALDYTVGASGFERLLKLRPVIERLPTVPYGTLMHLLAPALGRGPRPLEAFNVWPSNIEPEISRAIHARCFHGIPTSLLTSLATTFEPEGLRLESGFRFVDHASRLSFPVRLLAGSRDAQVSVDAVRHTAGLLGVPTDVIVHGPERGDADHYGHWDLLVGQRAEDETWPSVARWLER